MVNTATAPKLPDIAKLSLTMGRMLLEWGSNARLVSQTITESARGLGCTSVEIFVQHAAIIVMLRRGEESCVQMGKVGEHGVNLRYGEALLRVANRVARGELDCDSAQAELEALPKTARAYPPWVVCVATGLACAAFGRLLNADWLSFMPVWLGAGVGQAIRRYLLHHHKKNLFLVVTVVSFTAALIASVGSRLLGSGHLDIAATAAVLLLVPGPAVLNAQIDAIDGRPNLAAARALRVVFILLFMTLGLVVARQIAGI